MDRRYEFTSYSRPNTVQQIVFFSQINALLIHKQPLFPDLQNILVAAADFLDKCKSLNTSLN